MTIAKNSTYPILFGFAEVVSGQGFVARVAISHGRVLARQEDQGWWLDGVNPGAIAEGGPSLNEAVVKFRMAFRSVLMDFAEVASDFRGFQRSVQKFFQETDEETVSEWDAARAVVRDGKADRLGLQIDRFDSRSMSIKVINIAEAPRENVVKEDAPALAA